ncbi:MAG: nucleoside triphosphate pyrophosphatase [Pseudomonadota bacterium]|nr:nucleoside triphosphate pyrophosphatase [Pseudomonadota bacterium]
MEIVLASTSPYRRNLMRRLGLPFHCVAPEVDEQVEAGEEPERRAIRLARLKAQSAASTRLSSPSLCIGSDQVACLGDRLLRKPRTDERAAEQLAAASGNLLKFWTGVYVVSDSGVFWSRLVACEVQMRELSSDEIEHYIAIDRPLDCAGSFKWEALGISLFEFVRSPDPTALEGLPLIALCDLLRQAGVSLPSAAQARQD